MSSQPKKRVYHPKDSEKATFHVSLSGVILTEFRRQLVKQSVTANHLLNRAVKAEIHRLRREEAREKNKQDG